MWLVEAILVKKSQSYCRKYWIFITLHKSNEKEFRIYVNVDIFMKCHCIVVETNTGVKMQCDISWCNVTIPVSGCGWLVILQTSSQWASSRMASKWPTNPQRAFELICCGHILMTPSRTLSFSAAARNRRCGRSSCLDSASSTHLSRNDGILAH